LSGDANNGLFNRQSFIGLAQKGVGRAAMGTQYTPIHMAVGRTDPGQQNNMAGNVIYTTNTSQGNGESTISYTVRTTNALTLTTERIGGFQVNGFYNMNSGSANNTQTAMPTYPANATGYGKVEQQAAGVGVNYVLKKLNVDLAYQTLKSTNWLGGTQNTLALPGNASGAAPGAATPFGANVGQSQMYAGAVYDFGVLKAYVQYVSNKIQNISDENSYVNRTAQQIGVRSFITPKIEGWASGGTGRFEAATGQAIGVNKATQNFTGYQLGANYWLSKRTNLYGIFGSSQVASSSISASEGRSSYGLGLRHTF
jgi:predicted porin